MKARIVILVGCLIGSLHLNAQEFAIGLRGGLNSYNIGDLNQRGGSIETGQPDVLHTPNSEMGFQVGGYLNIEFGKFFIRPEFNYVSLKSNYELPLKTSHWESTKLDIPVLLGFKIIGPVSVYAGPGVNYFTKMTLEGANDMAGAGPISFQKGTFNLNVGAQVEFGRFGVDLRYEYGLNDTREELVDILRAVYGTNLADIRGYTPSQLSLSLYVYVFRTNSGDVGNFFTNLFRKKQCYCPY